MSSDNLNWMVSAATPKTVVRVVVTTLTTMRQVVLLEMEQFDDWRNYVKMGLHNIRNHSIDCGDKQHQSIPSTLTTDSITKVQLFTDRLCEEKIAIIQQHFRGKTSVYEKMITDLDEIEISELSVSAIQRIRMRKCRRVLIVSIQTMLVANEEFITHLSSLSNLIKFLYGKLPVHSDGTSTTTENVV